MNGLLTVREASRRLGITRFTLYKYLKRGKLKGKKIIGNQYRILEADLDEFIRGNGAEHAEANNNKP